MTSDRSRRFDIRFGPVVAFLISPRVVLDRLDLLEPRFFKADSGPTTVIGADKCGGLSLLLSPWVQSAA
jgi:hypothetical protein